MATVNLGRVGLVLKGEYDASTKYEKLDVVTYQGSSYIAKQATTGNAPTNESFWQLQSEKGEKGDKGDAGGGLTRLDDQTPVTVDGVLAGKNGKLAPADFVPAEILPTNTVAQAGIVAAPTANNANSLWSTDGSGNPAWTHYDYQTKAQIQQLIAEAISESGHASFEKIDHIPTVEEAKDNILYLVYNTKTEHYDIYAKVVNEQGTPEVLLIDDTTVDLSNYVTNEALAAKDYATNTALNAATTEINTNLNNKVDKESGKGLSSNDYTAAEKTKLEGIEASADVNKIESVKLNGEPLSIDEQKAVNIDLSGYATDTELSTGLSGKVDKQEGKQLSTEDFTTAYKNKLDGIPEGGGGGEVNIINTVKVNGTPLVPDAEKAVDVEIPTKTSELTNDSGFITSNDIPEGIAASTTVPKAPEATGSVGNELAFARGDHVHPHSKYEMTSAFVNMADIAQDWNELCTRYENRIYGVSPPDFELPYAPPAEYKYGLTFCIFSGYSSYGIQVYSSVANPSLFIRPFWDQTNFGTWSEISKLSDITASNFTGVLPVEKGGTGSSSGDILYQISNSATAAHGISLIQEKFSEYQPGSAAIVGVYSGLEPRIQAYIGVGDEAYSIYNNIAINQYADGTIVGTYKNREIATLTDYATTLKAGLVKPGAGLQVSDDGTLSLDKNYGASYGIIWGIQIDDTQDPPTLKVRATHNETAKNMSVPLDHFKLLIIQDANETVAKNITLSGLSVDGRDIITASFSAGSTIVTPQDYSALCAAVYTYYGRDSSVFGIPVTLPASGIIKNLNSVSYP